MPGSDGDSSEEALRIVRLELKLCKALTALNPPHEVSASLHARITDLLRRLKRHDATDEDVTQAADLSDEELHQAAAICAPSARCPRGKLPTGAAGPDSVLLLAVTRLASPTSWTRAPPETGSHSGCQNGFP